MQVEMAAALIGATVGAFMAVMSWLVTSKINLIDKRREFVSQYMIEAWTKLQNASNRENDKLHADLEAGVALIQLMGTSRQIRLAKQVARELSGERSANLDSILEQLRKELRQTLRLERLSGDDSHLVILRIIPGA